MSKLLSIELFEVKGFRGESTLKASIKDGILILVGDNGSGKTTFLRIFYFFLAGKWDSLSKMSFDSISISIDNLEANFTKQDVDLLAIGSDRLEGHYSDYEFMHERERIDFEMYISMRRRIERFNAPSNKKEVKKVRDLEKKFEQIKSKFNSQILYLPTYRRIERELSSIFEGREIKSVSGKDQSIRNASPSFVELVEFGMNDVKGAIEKNLESLKEFARKSATALNLGYLGDIVNKGYESEIQDFSDVSKSTIDAVLNRVDDSVLTQDHKNYISTLISSDENIVSATEHNKIIRHYFSKLLDFQEDLSKKEKNIIDFCLICSKYMKSKVFEYDNAKFQFMINNKINPKPNGIDLSDLSSGEKQIASLFSHLYLSNNKNYLVLIDEPELSLSVPWQKEFLLDIVNSGLCVGLVAVTHSPFIYANKLKGYATSMGELVS